MHHISCTNTHHDLTDLVNHAIVKNKITWISWEQNITFLRNKKILNLSLRWHILRSYRFLAEITVNACNNPIYTDNGWIPLSRVDKNIFISMYVALTSVTDITNLYLSGSYNFGAIKSNNDAAIEYNSLMLLSKDKKHLRLFLSSELLSWLLCSTFAGVKYFVIVQIHH